MVDANVDRKGTRAAAEAYLQFLYTDEAQEIIAKHYYRPINAGILKKHAEHASRTIDAVPDHGESPQDLGRGSRQTSSSSPRAGVVRRASSRGVAEQSVASCSLQAMEHHASEPPRAAGLLG